ncbi:unnamed protein product [Penicillium salamii]|uniref:Uncharacterized protein n=1 Tax=Penicillium salamii TaxID=1612424 RepID=A0A9W4JFB4_9EURO|nr:unnamed protein product [Penicillium salamii]
MTPQYTSLRKGIKPKPKNWSWRFLCLDTWIPEIIATLFSIACFIGICGILLAYNQKSRPELYYGLSLNAIISVLATGCRSSLIFVIGEAMGQLKWTWFYAKPQRLIDMQTLDSASRGPLGSITTLFKGTRRSLASLGAVIIIFLLAFDPFIQQIISYPIRLTTVSDGISPAITKRLGYFTPDLDYNTVYSTGLWSEDTILSPDCPSGNCTWSKFQSSGMCSQCSDITQSVDLKCGIVSDNSNTTKYSTVREVDVKCDLVPPQGNTNQFNLDFLFVASKDTSLENLSWYNYLTRKLSWHILSAYDFNAYNVRPQTKNQPFASPSDPLMVIGYAEIGYNEDYIDSDLIGGIRVDKATQCSLELCVLEYDVFVKNGTPNVTTSVVDYGELFWKKTSDPRISLGATTCWKPRSSPQDIAFENSKPGTFFQLSPVEFAFCGINFEIPLDESVFVGSTNQSDQGNSTKLDKLYGDHNTARIASIGLEKIMSNVAQHMNKEALHQNGSEVHGKAYITEVFVEVKWLWLILPIILVTSGTLFIAMVIFENKKNGTSLWKSSVLAFFYHGLYDVDSDSMAASVMEKKAEGSVVRLQASGDHGGLILKKEENSVQC